jgi:DNA polymerase/3'-5' exonuclease PolX
VRLHTFTLLCTGSRPNKYMAGWLRKLADEAMASGEPNAGFKRNAFVKAASTLESHTEAITSGKEALKLTGIGKGSVALIDEYLETGAMGERSKAEKVAKQAQPSKDEEEEADKEGGSAAASTAPPKRAKAGLAFLDVV